MNTTLALTFVFALLFSLAGIMPALVKELRQRGSDLDNEEETLRKEMKDLFGAARKSAGKKLTAEQETRVEEIKARLDAIASERLMNAEELRNEEALQESQRRARGVEVGHDLATDKPFASLGEQLQAIACAYGAKVTGNRSGIVDPRLFAAASGGSTQPPDGGFPIQRDFSTAMLDRAAEASVLVPLCDTYEVGENSDGVEFPTIDETSRANGSRWGGVRVYRRKEAGDVTASQVKYGEFDVRLEDLMAVTYMTGRQLQDARLTQQIMEKGVSSEFAFKMDDEIINGVGAGEMTGWLNSTALVTVAAEGGQAAGTVVPKNISKMWRAMPARSKPRSVWVINGELGPTLDELFIAAGVGALEPRFVTYGPDGIFRIKGRPVLEIEQAAAPGTAGDFSLVDLQEFLLVRKGGPQQDASMHVRFLFDEMTFRTIVRINGRPKWKQAIAPYKGSVSKSPFIVLGAR